MKNYRSTIITSRRNPLIARLRALSTKKGREEASLLLLEGTHLLQEALKTNYFPKEIIATDSWIRKYKNILESTLNPFHLYEVNDSVLKASLTTVNPDGVASLYPLTGLPKVKPKSNFILALYRVQDPGNLGNLFRIALAADIELLLIAGGVDPLNQKVLRSSSGAVLHLPYERFSETEKENLEYLFEKLSVAKDQGFQIIGTAVSSEEELRDVIPYWEIDWNQPTILLLGNEGSGLDQLLMDCCTSVVTLPHSASVESLNVAAASVPLLLERRRATMSNSV